MRVVEIVAGGIITAVIIYLLANGPNVSSVLTSIGGATGSVIASLQGRAANGG